MKTSNTYRFVLLLILLSTNTLISLADMSKYGRPSDFNAKNTDVGSYLQGVFLVFIGIIVIAIIGRIVNKNKK